MSAPRGFHLMLDGVSTNVHLLQNGKKLERLLDEIVDVIGMTKIAGPFIKLHIPEDRSRYKEWGYSGVVIIAESHISIHTYPELSYVSIDVYSCREFDKDKVIDTLTKKFHIVNKNVLFFQRGLLPDT